ncbi:MAG: hypothetical protein JWL63_2463 [Rhodocyclales bacterium]|nr:hypothetical protein [Rhodocyclales bacterium]
MERFGQKLLAVRYRQSADGKKRYVTVELLVSTRESRQTRGHQIDPIVEIRTFTHEIALHDQLKANGAVWNGRTQTWKVRHSIIIKLGIAKKITQNSHT